MLWSCMADMSVQRCAQNARYAPPQNFARLEKNYRNKKTPAIAGIYYLRRPNFLIKAS